MNDLQKKILEIYVDVQGILERNDIRHYVLYGAAIGAIRHGGFIPWDDDMDICIFREDMDRFVDAMNRELDLGKYYLQLPNSGDCLFSMYKVGMKGTTFITETYEGEDFDQGIFVDVFIMEGIPEGRFKKRMYLTSKFLRGCAEHYFYVFENRTIRKFLKFLNRIFDRFMDDHCVDPDSRYVIHRPTTSNNTYSRSLFGTPRMCRFEDISVPLPDDVESFLNAYYGDYMELPPEEERVPKHCKYYNTEMDWREYYGKKG